MPIVGLENSMRMFPKAAKSQYSETEAAAELGVSVERLRTLIREHILLKEDDGGHPPLATFQPSDLLVLKLLSTASTAETPRG
jgi:hypothetical protein